MTWQFHVSFFYFYFIIITSLFSYCWERKKRGPQCGRSCTIVKVLWSVKSSSPIKLLAVLSVLWSSVLFAQLCLLQCNNFHRFVKRKKIRELSSNCLLASILLSPWLSYSQKDLCGRNNGWNNSKENFSVQKKCHCALCSSV